MGPPDPLLSHVLPKAFNILDVPRHRFPVIGQFEQSLTDDLLAGVARVLAASLRVRAAVLCSWIGYRHPIIVTEHAWKHLRFLNGRQRAKPRATFRPYEQNE
jgi:hypothetical protein